MPARQKRNVLTAARLSRACGMSAGGGGRTHTTLAGPGILSPVRLPASPPRRAFIMPGRRVGGSPARMAPPSPWDPPYVRRAADATARQREPSKRADGIAATKARAACGDQRGWSRVRRPPRPAAGGGGGALTGALSRLALRRSRGGDGWRVAGSAGNSLTVGPALRTEDGVHLAHYETEAAHVYSDDSRRDPRDRRNRVFLLDRRAFPCGAHHGV